MVRDYRKKKKEKALFVDAYVDYEPALL